MQFDTKKFLSYYKPYKKLFTAVMVAAFFSAGVALLFPLCTKYVTEIVLSHSQQDQNNVLNKILLVGGIMIVLAILQNALDYFVDYKGHCVGAKMERDIRSELYAHYQKLSFGFYDEHKTGQLMSRITNDLLSLAELYHHAPEDLMINFVRFIGAFIILININLKLTLTIFAFLPFMVLFIAYFSRKMRIAIKKSRDKIGDVNAHVEETIAGIRVVKSFANEQKEEKKFNCENNAFYDSRKCIYKSEAICYQGMEIFTQLILVAIVILGGASIVNTSLSAGDFVAFLLYANYLIGPAKHLVHMISQFQEGFAGFDRFMEIMNISPDIQDRDDAVTLSIVKGDITFDNVSFKYNENQEYILQNLSFTAKSGDYIALVGFSGVGKTTLCSLIPRFYNITDGAISIDGIDIRNINLTSLREHIGIVQQDVYLFSGSVLSNIGYGKEGASREEIIEAAKNAHANEFIMELPQQYDTDIGERGVKLSGGQKQRLSIARVFLKNPPILIFDEATSSLDNHSEIMIQQSLERLACNRTTFVIAHRLSTIKNANRIIVVEDQGIKEQGTHDELMALGKSYASLYRNDFTV